MANMNKNKDGQPRHIDMTNAPGNFGWDGRPATLKRFYWIRVTLDVILVIASTIASIFRWEWLSAWLSAIGGAELGTIGIRLTETR
jgi:hypothetical protein